MGWGRGRWLKWSGGGGGGWRGVGEGVLRGVGGMDGGVLKGLVVGAVL